MDATTIHLNSIVCRTGDPGFIPLDDELMAMDEKLGYLYSMNKTASRVWHLIEQPSAVIDICTRLCREFAVDVILCRQEVLSLLCQLHQAGLIQVSRGEVCSKV